MQAVEAAIIGTARRAAGADLREPTDRAKLMRRAKSARRMSGKAYRSGNVPVD